MKASIFNNRLSLSKNTDVLFNAYTEEFIAINHRSSLEFDHQDANSQDLLSSKGFFIRNEIDEYRNIMERFRQCQLNDDVFRLTINPTLKCNFGCWYCYETHTGNTKMNEECINNIKSLIDNLSCNYKSVELSFFGGEPMLYYNEIVKSILEHINKISNQTDLKYRASFTTNGYLITDKMVNDLLQYNLGVFQITLDGGPLSHNSTRVSKQGDSFSKIVCNIRKMIQRGIQVLLRINVTKENIKGAFEIIKYFEDIPYGDKMNLHLFVQQVWQDVQNDILDDVWDLYSEFIKIGILPWPRRFSFYKSICYADNMHSTVVNYNGKIYKCTAVDFDKVESIGELKKDGIIEIHHPFDLRSAKRNNNPNCKTCRILPLCNGGCAKSVDQAASVNYCLHPTDEDKDKVVKNVIREKLHMARLGLLGSISYQ